VDDLLVLHSHAAIVSSNSALSERAMKGIFVSVVSLDILLVCAFDL